MLYPTAILQMKMTWSGENTGTGLVVISEHSVIDKTATVSASFDHHLGGIDHHYKSHIAMCFSSLSAHLRTSLDSSYRINHSQDRLVRFDRNFCLLLHGYHVIADFIE